MENEIKVNEYVRLQNGVIGTVIEIKTVSTNMRGKHAYAYKLGKTKKYNSCWVEDYAIVKHSTNLIDLIQKDDFVNGDRVVAIDYTEDENGNYVDVLGIMEIDDDYAYPIELRVINIQEIATKEMMESISYKVGKE